MAARKKPARKKSTRRKAGRKRATKKTGRKRAAKKTGRKRAAASRSGGRKAGGKKAAGKSATTKGTKKAAKKKSTKKAAKKKGSTLPPKRITILDAWPRPGTLPAKRGQEVIWVNEDSVGYTLEFAESPFLPGRSGETIEIGAGPGTRVSRVIHHAKKKGNYHYDLVDVPRAGHPPTEPQVSVGD